jgi:hypothetical protein
VVLGGDVLKKNGLTYIADTFSSQLLESSLVLNKGTLVGFEVESGMVGISRIGRLVCLYHIDFGIFLEMSLFLVYLHLRRTQKFCFYFLYRRGRAFRGLVCETDCVQPNQKGKGARYHAQMADTKARQFEKRPV